MPTYALTTPEAIQSWAAPEIKLDRLPEIAKAIDAATNWLENVSNRRLKRDVVTIYLDGSDGCPYPGQFGDALELPAEYRPVVWASPTTLVTVKEDGVSLTVAVGYSATADVLLVNPNREHQARLIRRGSWGAGVSNIEVGLTFGYSVSTAPTTPGGLRQLTNEVAWLFYSTPTWLGKASFGGSSAKSVDYDVALSRPSQAYLEALMNGVLL